MVELFATLYTGFRALDDIDLLTLFTNSAHTRILPVEHFLRCFRVCVAPQIKHRSWLAVEWHIFWCRPTRRPSQSEIFYCTIFVNCEILQSYILWMKFSILKEKKKKQKNPDLYFDRWKFLNNSRLRTSQPHSLSHALLGPLLSNIILILIATFVNLNFFFLELQI